MVNFALKDYVRLPRLYSVQFNDRMKIYEHDSSCPRERKDEGPIRVITGGNESVDTWKRQGEEEREGKRDGVVQCASGKGGGMRRRAVCRTYLGATLVSNCV